MRAEKRIEPPEQIAARSGQALRECRWGLANPPHQFSAAQTASQIDSLACEITTQVECARIEKIARLPRSQQRFDAISRAQSFGSACCLLAIQIRTQTAAD